MQYLIMRYGGNFEVVSGAELKALLDDGNRVTIWQLAPYANPKLLTCYWTVTGWYVTDQFGQTVYI